MKKYTIDDLIAETEWALAHFGVTAVSSIEYSRNPVVEDHFNVELIIESESSLVRCVFRKVTPQLVWWEGWPVNGESTSLDLPPDDN